MKEKTFINLVGVAVFVAVLALGVVYNHYAYGDWTCMFKRCVVVGNIKP